MERRIDMEVVRAMRQGGVIRVIGLSAAVLWLGSAATLAVPRTVHAQDESAISGDSSAATNDSDVSDDNDADTDTDTDAANPDAVPAFINGDWSGSATDKRHGAGSLSMTFTQTEGSKVVVVSPWEVSFADTTDAGGTGSGKVSAKALKLVLFDPTISSKCRMTVSAKITVDSGVAEEIKGKYTIKKCFSKNSSGTLDLTPTS
jgi:hypothetical protein